MKRSAQSLRPADEASARQCAASEKSGGPARGTSPSASSHFFGRRYGTEGIVVGYFATAISFRLGSANYVFFKSEGLTLVETQLRRSLDPGSTRLPCHARGKRLDLGGRMRIFFGFLLAICKSLVRLVQQQWWRGYFAASGARIGRGVIIEKDSDCQLSIGSGSAVGFGTLLIVKSEFGLAGRLRIGEHTAVNEYNNLRAAGGEINIGSHCQISQFCTLVATNHTTETSKFMIDAPWDRTKTSINIEDDVWIGANSVILPGVRIGRGAVIGAGSVITKDVPDHSVFAGVPAKFIRRRTLFAQEP